MKAYYTYNIVIHIMNIQQIGPLTKKLFLVLPLFLLVFLGSPQKAKASEGIFELRNTTGENARCFATSVLMDDNAYHILVSCRDILYPGGTEVFSYVTWATKTDSDNVVKLGTLGVGKVQFKTKSSFKDIFVTKETSSDTRSPKGQTIMKGGLQKIALLENTNAAPYSELGEPEASPTASPKTGSSLNIFRLGGAFAIVALVGIIAGVFFLIRTR
jgi:hypothetical protein